MICCWASMDSLEFRMYKYSNLNSWWIDSMHRKRKCRISLLALLCLLLGCFYSPFQLISKFCVSHSTFGSSSQYFINLHLAEIRVLTMWIHPNQALSHLYAAILLHSSLANPVKQNIYLVWVLFCLHASGQCLAGKIHFHLHHSFFAEWILLSSRISLYFVTFITAFPEPATEKYQHVWCLSNLLSIQRAP